MNLFTRAYKEFKRRKRKYLLRKVIEIQNPNMETIRIGTDYGGFFVAPLKRWESVQSRDKFTIYSFGVGEDISFDEEMIKRFQCSVFAFDPNPLAIEYISNRTKLFDEFHFYPYGLSDMDQIAKMYLPRSHKISASLICYEDVSEEYVEVELKKLSTIMKELGHDRVDLIKMDIEGCEFDVIDDILNSGIVFDELCLEVHDRFFTDGIKRLKRMIQGLNDHGFLITAVSKNMQEITFVRM